MTGVQTCALPILVPYLRVVHGRETSPSGVGVVGVAEGHDPGRRVEGRSQQLLGGGLSWRHGDGRGSVEAGAGHGGPRLVGVQTWREGRQIRHDGVVLL